MNLQETEKKQSKYVLVADVDRIKDFIFASVRLRHVINASSLLAYINEDKTESIIGKIPNSKLIFSSAGITEATFCSENDAKECKKAIESLYPKETKGATVTVDYAPMVNDDFVDAVRETNRRIRLKKDSGVTDQDRNFETTPFFIGSPFFRICSQTGKEFATEWKSRNKEESQENFGASAWNLHNFNLPESMKAELPSGDLIPLNSKLGDRLKVDVLLRHQLAQEMKCNPDDFEYPTDFDDFQGAKPANYMGFIEADGNGFGDILSSLAKNEANEETYEKFSKLLKNTTQEAFIESAVSVIKPLFDKKVIRQNKKGKLPIPLRILILGGDDVFAVTLPQIILPFADEFCRRFQQIAEYRKNESESKIKALDPFTMSAGVVIAHHNFPFLSFQKLSHSLLKNAKRRSWSSRKDEKRQYGSVDYQIITASGADDLKSMRKEIYTLNYQDGKKFYLTGKPYLVSPCKDELQDLLNYVKIMKDKDKGIARGQVKALYDILHDEEKKSVIDFIKWYCRLAKDGQDIIKCLLDTNDVCLSPWIKDNRPGNESKIYTPLFDAAELYDILQVEEQL